MTFLASEQGRASVQKQKFLKNSFCFCWLRHGFFAKKKQINVLFWSYLTFFFRLKINSEQLQVSGASCGRINERICFFILYLMVFIILKTFLFEKNKSIKHKSIFPFPSCLICWYLVLVLRGQIPYYQSS